MNITRIRAAARSTSKPTLLAAAVLSLCVSCAVLSARADIVQLEGPFARASARVIDRYEAYLPADSPIEMGQIERVRATLANFTEVPVIAISVDLYPILDGHDAYVRADVMLEELELETYLGSSERLRAILKRAEASR